MKVSVMNHLALKLDSSTLKSKVNDIDDVFENWLAIFFHNVYKPAKNGVSRSSRLFRMTFRVGRTDCLSVHSYCTMTLQRSTLWERFEQTTVPLCFDDVKLVQFQRLRI